MRKLALQMQVSLDGFVGGPSGELDWIFSDFDSGFEKWTLEKLWQAGAHLMGSATYSDMAAHWPISTESYAPPMNEIPKIVFSRHLREAKWRDTRIVSGDLAEEIRRLKEGSGKDLLAHGGSRFAQSLVSTGLIDEYRLVVHPIALGRGLRLFPDRASPIRLSLTDLVRFKTGAMAKIYRPAPT